MVTAEHRSSLEIHQAIRDGRTDFIFELLKQQNWCEQIAEGSPNLLQWFVYYGDVTAMRTVLHSGGTLDAIQLGEELGNAAFFGHWKMCDFLLEKGADVNFKHKDTGETALHSALCKAGRPYFEYVVRLLLENGADTNATTIPGVESGGFMRDVRTCGETPLHRAAAFADEPTIELLLEHGADKQARDAHGNSPLSWASWHLRPGGILHLLSFGQYRVSPQARHHMTSDHGAGWGYGMERNLLGKYLPRAKWIKATD